MTNVLITGRTSYIGLSFKKYLEENFKEQYNVETISVGDDSWKNIDFSKYDVVLHLAAIVHQKETKENAEEYYKVNSDLTIEIANKAKSDGVKQFIFMSSIAVFGKDHGKIDLSQNPTPKTNYGKSKLLAEQELEKLNGNSFKVCIIRSPMVYGEGCNGNLKSLVKIVKKFSAFPKVRNKRVAISVDKLVAFIKEQVDSLSSGTYLPHDDEYFNTSEYAKGVAKSLDKKIYLSYFLGFCVCLLYPFSKKVRKAFGNLV